MIRQITTTICTCDKCGKEVPDIKDLNSIDLPTFDEESVFECVETFDLCLDCNKEVVNFMKSITG